MPTGPRPTPEGVPNVIQIGRIPLKVNFLIQGEDEPKPGITTAAEVPAPAWKPEVVSYS